MITKFPLQRWNVMFLAILVSFCACQIDFSGRRKKRDKNIESAAPVMVQKVARGNISTYLRFNSIIEPLREVDVYSRTIGKVSKLMVEEGDIVKEGQLLALLEDAEQQITLKRAQTELEHNQIELNRARELSSKQMLSVEDLTRAELAFKNAQIAVEQAELMLSYTRITAPISGIISNRFINLGDRVDQTRVLFRIVDRSKLQLNIWVSETESKYMHKGMSAEIITPVDTLKKANVYLVRLGNVVDPTYGKIKATFEFVDENNIFKPGQYVELRMVLETHYNTILVPKSAIIYESGSPFVFTTRDTIALKRPVITGIASGAVIEIINGVGDYDTIITDGHITLRDSATVKVLNW